jgi:hypothetical protein
LSSAILYVAIVAIWACVLIPRWLRRDSSVSVPVSSPADDQGTSGADEEPEPSGQHLEDRAEAEELTAPAEERSVPVERRSVPVERRSVPVERRSIPREERSVPGSVPGEERSAVGERRDLPSDPGHRRVLSARRRLLLLLVALTIASGVLAGIGLAAWWVTVPPSVMLVCYLLLLRAAAKADAERRELAYDQAYTRAAHAAAAAPPARPARPARAEVLAFSGASALEARDDEEIYDQYADAKLRAVGD